MAPSTTLLPLVALLLSGQPGEARVATATAAEPPGSAPLEALPMEAPEPPRAVPMEAPEGGEVQLVVPPPGSLEFTDVPSRSAGHDPAAVQDPAALGSFEFIKGEIAHAGTIRVIPKRSFVGVRLGALLQDTTLYLAVSPKAELEFLDRKLRIGVEVPLNLEIYSLQRAADAGDGQGGFHNLGRLRSRDYDEAREFVKILRYLTYGRKEDNLYLSVGQLYATTLGHGQAMRRYAANVDVNHTRVGFQLDAYGDYGGFEAAVADVTRGNLFGVLAFVKPLFFMEHELLRTLSVGLHWTSDQKAPFRLRRAAPVGTSPIGMVLVDDTSAPFTDTRAINIVGVDAELKVLKTASTDLKTYADFSALSGGGSGQAIGLLGRFNFRTDSTVHLVRTRVELRTYEANFQPSYFDTLYEFQKYQFVLDADRNRADFPTKLQHVLSRTGPRRYGMYLEASYSLPDWITLAAAFETESEGEDRHLLLHVEVPLRYLDLFATYHQRNFQRLFQLAENDLIYGGARMQLLPVLFLNGRVAKAFEWRPEAFNGLGAYGESLNYQVDVEFGFEI